MRTTVTLDQDVARMIREAMHKSRRSFKETLNVALRAGLSDRRTGKHATPFKVKARPLGLQAGFDPAGFNRLVDDLEGDAVCAGRSRAARLSQRGARRASGR